MRDKFKCLVLLVHELIENKVWRVSYNSAETTHTSRVGNTKIHQGLETVFGIEAFQT